MTEEGKGREGKGREGKGHSIIRTHDGPKILYIPLFLHSILGPDYHVPT